jgi:hypothetical protein
VGEIAAALHSKAATAMKRPITKLNEIFFLRVIEELISEIWLSHTEEREVFKITVCVAYV